MCRHLLPHFCATVCWAVVAHHVQQLDNKVGITLVPFNEVKAQKDGKYLLFRIYQGNRFTASSQVQLHSILCENVLMDTKLWKLLAFSSSHLSLLCHLSPPEPLLVGIKEKAYVNWTLCCLNSGFTIMHLLWQFLIFKPSIFIHFNDFHCQILHWFSKNYLHEYISHIVLHISWVYEMQHVL